MNSAIHKLAILNIKYSVQMKLGVFCSLRRIKGGDKFNWANSDEYHNADGSVSRLTF